MTAQPLAILASGMVTSVGLSAPATCAAIRCAIDNFTETRFLDRGGEWIIGSQVPLEQPWRGLRRLVHLVVPAVRECLAFAGNPRPASLPLLLCVAERGRPGRADGLEQDLFQQVAGELGVAFSSHSAVVPYGRQAAVMALSRARELLYREQAPLCVIAGVDSFLATETLEAYETRFRLLTSRNSNGFVPGEAGTAVLVGLPQRHSRELLCLGIGHGSDPATIESEEPLRGSGMVQAFTGALSESGYTFDQLQYRITDLSGEQYGFKEAALAVSRVARTLKPAFDIWHPADCVGEIGAAIGPCLLGVALAAARGGYAPGPNVLCHLASDGPDRYALVLSYG